MPTTRTDPPLFPDAAAGKADLKALARLLARWQPPQTGMDGQPPSGQKAGKPWALAGLDPAAKPFSSGDKQRDKALVDTLAAELDELQNLFYADKRFKLLVILQGTDTAGKDGTLRGVFGRISPLGVHTVSWRAPNEAERAHDYLWRIHQQVPAAGVIQPLTGGTSTSS